MNHIRGWVLGVCDGFQGYFDVDWDYWEQVWYERGWWVGKRVGDWTVFRV